MWRMNSNPPRPAKLVGLAGDCGDRQVSISNQHLYSDLLLCSWTGMLSELFPLYTSNPIIGHITGWHAYFELWIIFLWRRVNEHRPVAMECKRPVQANVFMDIIKDLWHHGTQIISVGLFHSLAHRVGPVVSMKKDSSSRFFSLTTEIPIGLLYL